MDGWRQYVYSIAVCAVICGFISQIISDTKKKALVRLITGTVLGICILQPLSQVRPDELLRTSVFDFRAGNHYIEEGEKTAADLQKQYIKDSCEAYILDKAARMGTEIRVDITLDQDMLPFHAEIRGNVTPLLQTELQKILAMDLGIPKENQEWIGNLENSSSSLP